MKDKILVFIIGMLVGAIITATGFLIYQKANKNNNQMPMGEMQMMERPDGEEPPEKPEGMENDESRPEPPLKNDSSTNNKTKKKGDKNEEQNSI